MPAKMVKAFYTAVALFRDGPDSRTPVISDVQYDTPDSAAAWLKNMRRDERYVSGMVQLSVIVAVVPGRKRRKRR